MGAGPMGFPSAMGAGPCQATPQHFSHSGAQSFCSPTTTTVTWTTLVRREGFGSELAQQKPGELKTVTKYC